MQAFVLVAEEGSIQGAAAKSFRTQSAVSRQVQRLEEMLGTRLLDRRAKPPRLSADGIVALERCRDILAQYQGLKALFGDAEPSGLLRVGIAHGANGASLVKQLGEAAARFPKLALRIHAGWSADLDWRVREGALDAAVVLRVAADQGREASPYDLLVVGPAGQDRLSPIRHAVFDLPWVLSPEPCEVRAWLSQTCARHGCRFDVAAEVQDPSLQLMLVAQGAGLGILPRGVVERHARPDILVHDVGLLRSRLRCELVRSTCTARMEPVLALLEAACP